MYSEIVFCSIFFRVFLYFVELPKCFVLLNVVKFCEMSSCVRKLCDLFDFVGFPKLCVLLNVVCFVECCVFCKMSLFISEMSYFVKCCHKYKILLYTECLINSLTNQYN